MKNMSHRKINNNSRCLDFKIMLDNQMIFEIINSKVCVYISNIIVLDILIIICKNICNNTSIYTKKFNINVLR